MKTKHRRPNYNFNKTFKNIHWQIENYKTGGESTVLNSCNNNPFMFRHETPDDIYFYIICTKIPEQNAPIDPFKKFYGDDKIFKSSTTDKKRVVKDYFNNIKPIFVDEFNDSFKICKLLKDKINSIADNIFFNVESADIDNTDINNIEFKISNDYKLPFKLLTNHFAIKKLKCKKKYNATTNNERIFENIKPIQILQLLNILLFTYGVKINTDNNKYTILLENDNTIVSNTNTEITFKHLNDFDNDNSSPNQTKLVFFKIEYLISEEFEMIYDKIAEMNNNALLSKLESYISKHRQDLKKLFFKFYKDNIFTDAGKITIDKNDYNFFVKLFDLLNQNNDIGNKKLLLTKDIQNTFYEHLMRNAKKGFLQPLKKLGKNMPIFDDNLKKFLDVAENWATKNKSIVNVFHFDNNANNNAFETVFGNYQKYIDKDNAEKYIHFAKFIRNTMSDIYEVFDDIVYTYEFDAEMVEHILMNGDFETNYGDKFNSNPLIKNLIVKNYELLKDPKNLLYYRSNHLKEYWNIFANKMVYYAMRDDVSTIDKFIDNTPSPVDDIHLQLEQIERQYQIKLLNEFENYSIEFNENEKIDYAWIYVNGIYDKLVDFIKNISNDFNKNRVNIYNIPSLEDKNDLKYLIYLNLLLCNTLFEIFIFMYKNPNNKIEDNFIVYSFGIGFVSINKIATVVSTSLPENKFYYDNNTYVFQLKETQFNEIKNIAENIQQIRSIHQFNVKVEFYDEFNNYDFKIKNEEVAYAIYRINNSIKTIYINQIRTPFTFFYLYRRIDFESNDFFNNIEKKYTYIHSKANTNDFKNNYYKMADETIDFDKYENIIYYFLNRNIRNKKVKYSNKINENIIKYINEIFKSQKVIINKSTKVDNVAINNTTFVDQIVERVKKTSSKIGSNKFVQIVGASIPETIFLISRISTFKTQPPTSADPNPTPTNNSTTPANNGTTPANHSTNLNPTNDGTYTANNGTTPTNDGTTPTNDGTNLNPSNDDTNSIVHRYLRGPLNTIVYLPNDPQTSDYLQNLDKNINNELFLGLVSTVAQIPIDRSITTDNIKETSKTIEDVYNLNKILNKATPLQIDSYFSNFFNNEEELKNFKDTHPDVIDKFADIELFKLEILTKTNGFKQFLHNAKIEDIDLVIKRLEKNNNEVKTKIKEQLLKFANNTPINILNNPDNQTNITANEILRNTQTTIENIPKNAKPTVVGTILQAFINWWNPPQQIITGGPTLYLSPNGTSTSGGNTNEPNDNIEQLFLLQLIFETDTITPDDEQNGKKVKKIFNLIYFAKVYYEFIVFIILNNNDDDNDKDNIFKYYIRVLNKIEVKFHKIMETEKINFNYKHSNKKETIKNYIKIIIAMMLFKLTDKKNNFNELQFQYFLKLRGFDEIIDENTDKIIYDLNKETQIILEDKYKYNFLLPEETFIPDNYLPLIFSLIFNYNNDFLQNILSNNNNNNNINNNNSNTKPDTNSQNEPNTLYNIFSSSVLNRVNSAINTGFEIVNDVVKSNYPKEYEKTVKIGSKIKEKYFSKKNEDEDFPKKFEDFIKELIPCIINSYLNFANDLASNYVFKIAIMNNDDDNKKNNYEYFFDKNFKELNEKINYLLNNLKTLIPKFAEGLMSPALNDAQTLVNELIGIINELKNYKIEIDPNADVNKKLTDALNKIAMFIADNYKEFHNNFFGLISSYYNVYEKSLFNPKNRASNYNIKNVFTKFTPFEIQNYFNFKQINTPYKFFENMTSAIFDDTTKFKKKYDDTNKIYTNENEQIDEEYFKKMLNEHDSDLQIKRNEIEKVSTFIVDKLIKNAKPSVSSQINKCFNDEKIKDEIITEIKKNKNIGKTLSFEENTKLLKGISDKYLEKMRVIMFVFAKFPPEWIFDVHHIMNKYVFSVKYLLDEYKEVVIDENDKTNYLKLMIETLNKCFDKLPKDNDLLLRSVYIILNSVYLLENYENNLELLLNVLLKSIKLDDVNDQSNLLKLVSEMKKEEKHNLGIKYLYYIVKVICLVNCYKKLSEYKETPETTAPATLITTSAEKKIIDYIKTFEFNFVDVYYPNLTLKYETLSINDTIIQYNKEIYFIQHDKNEAMPSDEIENLHNNFYQKIGSVIDENDVDVKEYAKYNLYYDFLTFDKEHIVGNKNQNEKSYFYKFNEEFVSPLLTSTETPDDMFQDIQTKIDENKIVFTLNPDKNGIVV